jgi:hypothetical protein
MTALGGPPDVIQAVKASGGQPGPMSVWVTGGALKWGTGNLDSHYKACKAAGVPPLVKFWYWGDDISTRAILDGVKDQYQGTWKTRKAGLELARAIGAKAKNHGVSPIVAIEHEFAQEGLETDPSAFAPYYDEAAAVLRAECPTTRIAFCCPIWEDEALIASTYKAQIASSDLVASQTLLFPPRHASREFTNAGRNFEEAFANLRRLAPGKPSCIVDVGFSSYGGAYSKEPPFAGGDGRGNDALQKAAIDGIVERAPAMGLEFIVARSLKDNASFAVSNYGGYAERHVGVIRADGSKKPAYESLLAIAKAAAPPPAPSPDPSPLEVCRAESAQLRRERDEATAAANGARQRLETARAALTPLQAALAPGP